MDKKVESGFHSYWRRGPARSHAIPGLGEGMPIVREREDDVELNCVVSNSFGFGGTNASLALKRYEP